MNKPDFPSWKRESLDQFALEAFDSMIDLQDACVILRRQIEDERVRYLARIKVLMDDRDRLLDFHKQHHR